MMGILLMTPCRYTLGLTLTICLAGCRSTESLPELPVLDVTAFQPAVRKVVETALEAARAQPKDAAAVAKLGMALQAHDRFGAAAICYQRAQVLDPKKFEYAYYWGAALVADGKYAEALVPLRRALTINKDAVPARLKLADALLAAGQTKDAQAEYNKVIAHGGDATAYYGLGRTQDGAEAIASFQKALSLFPRYGAAQYALAAAYRKAGQTEKAEQTLAGYELNKSNVPPLDDQWMAAVYVLNVGATGLMRRAQVLEQQGRLVEAATLQEEALEQDPKLAQAWINLISLYGRLGRFDQAEAAFQKAVELVPNQADVYYNLGVLRLTAERYGEARKAFEKTVQLDPRHANGLRNLGTLAEQAGQLDRAAQYYQQALASMPEFRAVRFQLGRVYANQRRYEDAIKQFQAALEPADEQTPMYRYALAATEARVGRRQESIVEMRRAREEAVKFQQTDLAAAIERDLARLGAGR